MKTTKKGIRILIRGDKMYVGFNKEIDQVYKDLHTTLWDISISLGKKYPALKDRIRYNIKKEDVEFSNDFNQETYVYLVIWSAEDIYNNFLSNTERKIAVSFLKKHKEEIINFIKKQINEMSFEKKICVAYILRRGEGMKKIMKAYIENGEEKRDESLTKDE